MSDMYGKLGDLLNNVLETGEVPQDEITKDQDPISYKGDGENSDPFFMQNSAKEKQIPHRKTYKINENPQGKVYKADNISEYSVKMHKYAKLMHIQNIPCIVSKSLDTLHIVSLVDLNDEKLKVIYHKRLKEIHPDTQVVDGKNNFTVDEIITAYNTVKNFLDNL